MDEIHPIAKTPLYVVYPGLRPFRNMLTCIPQMQYAELTNEEHEMNDLLGGQEVSSSAKVMINGREIIKKHAAKTKQ